MDQQESAGALSEEMREREVIRRAIELNLLDGLRDLFIEGDEESTSFHRNSFLDYLSQITHSWQTLDSGTVGEVITHWVGRGFLVDFPEFQEYSADKEWRSVKIEPSASGKPEVRAVAAYRDGPKQYTATYRFRISKDEIDQRMKEARTEKDEFSRLYTEMPSSD